MTILYMDLGHIHCPPHYLLWSLPISTDPLLPPITPLSTFMALSLLGNPNSFIIGALVRGYLQEHVGLSCGYSTEGSISPSPNHQLPINPQRGGGHHWLRPPL